MLTRASQPGSLHRSLAPELRRVAEVVRVPLGEGDERSFSCYRLESDAPDSEFFSIRNPFPHPKKRTEATQARGRFVLDPVGAPEAREAD